MRLEVVLHNIRSTYNVGAILRTAEGLGVGEVIYSGYTPRFNDPRLLPHLQEKLDRQIAKSALGAERLVEQKATDDVAEWLKQRRADGWVVIGLENNLSAAELARRVVMRGCHKKTLLGKHEKIVLVLGEEVGGIPDEVRSRLDYFLEIPMRGQKESFNVSVAAGMAMWWLMDDEEQEERPRRI